MQYVRSLGGSVSKTWNSINPATLSGAIDVIVVEQQDGSLACSPFHVRFGKFSLLRPYEKKVEFNVNNIKQHHAMKLGEGGEAFFVFETTDEIPQSMQTSPVISPAASPHGLFEQDLISTPSLQEPEHLDLNTEHIKHQRHGDSTHTRPVISGSLRMASEYGTLSPITTKSQSDTDRLGTGGIASGAQHVHSQIKRSASEELLPTSTHSDDDIYRTDQQGFVEDHQTKLPLQPALATSAPTERSISPPLLSANDAVSRAKSLSKKLSMSQIPTHVTDNGDLMLDMTGYKSSEDEALRAEVIARKILSEELEGDYDIGALIGADERGNLWIYSSEEAKDAAGRRLRVRGLEPNVAILDAASDPGYQSEEDTDPSVTRTLNRYQRAPSVTASIGLVTPPRTPPAEILRSGDPSRNYAKTLRLTSDQLKALNLKPGENTISFSVNRATCQAYMYYWTYDVPIVISDIDGTITKSDALGHVLNMIGRDWTHIGVAKLYFDIVANGYNILYLTSRSVGQADTTRTYLNGIFQEGYRLPKGPVIMSPDRTIAALRREIYLRKPEVFKMACLRDILSLFSPKSTPFYAGFGNRLTDALSYRSVRIPSTRIFTINSNAEVSLDLLTLNKYTSSYVTMREVVDHFFPPVGLLVTGGGEDFTDFNYWRDTPLNIEDFSDSDTDEVTRKGKDRQSMKSEDEGSEGFDDDDQEAMADSYLSKDSIDEGDDGITSILEGINDNNISARSSLEEEGSNMSTDVVVGVDVSTASHADRDRNNDMISLKTPPNNGSININPGLHVKGTEGMK